MKALRCKMGMHKMRERQRRGIVAENWTSTLNGKETPYNRYADLVTYECVMDDCIQRRNYIIKWNNKDGSTTIETRTEVHPDYAEEIKFLDEV
jgi:hypothetical protein